MFLKIKDDPVDLPEIFQQLEGHSDFYRDELALPAPKLASPFVILKGKMGEEKEDILLLNVRPKMGNSKNKVCVCVSLETNTY